MSAANEPASNGPAPARAEASVDDAEIAKFAALAETWWDPAGPMAPLHQLNPLRVGYVREHLIDHFGLDGAGRQPLAGLKIADIGCGGGILSEPLARLGATVTGLDLAAENLEAARRHARASGLEIDYRRISAEALARTNERYDATVAMEVVEHVTDLEAFLAATATLTRPGGALFLATINRTAKAFLFAIVGAEQILRWLPPGTHRFDRFVKPSQLRSALTRHGIEIKDVAGVGWAPLARSWRLSRDKAVNYMLVGIKPPAR